MSAFTVSQPDSPVKQAHTRLILLEGLEFCACDKCAASREAWARSQPALAGYLPNDGEDECT